MDQALSRVFLDVVNRRTKVLGQLFEAAPNPRNAFVIVLEIAEHFGKILRPKLQLRRIFDWHSQHLRGDRIRDRFREIGDHIHLSQWQ